MEKLQKVYVDFLPNAIKAGNHQLVAETLRQQFDSELPQLIERTGKLPVIAITREDDWPQAYVSLLVESRRLFVRGMFYSCVAMCGIVSERILKDLLRKAICIRKDRSVVTPTGPAFDQLERIDLNNILEFLGKTELIPEPVKKDCKKLLELRNAYAHAHAKAEGTEEDALKAIELLNSLLNSTVSVLHKLS